VVLIYKSCCLSFFYIYFKYILPSGNLLKSLIKTHTNMTKIAVNMTKIAPNMTKIAPNMTFFKKVLTNIKL